MKRNKKWMQILAVCLLMMMVTLTACGNTNQGDAIATMAPVSYAKEQDEDIQENTKTKAVDAISDAAKMVADAPMSELNRKLVRKADTIPYAEKNELEFCEDTVVKTQGVIVNINDKDDMKQVDAEMEILSIDIEDSENDTQTITIKYECRCDIWTDGGSRLLANANLPNIKYWDLYTGNCFPEVTIIENGDAGYQTVVEWNGEFYEVSCTEEAEWLDRSEWVSDGNKSYTASCAVSVTDVIVVTKGYDGLGMLLTDFTLDDMANLTEGVSTEELSISDFLESDDSSIIFNVANMSELLNEDSEEDSAVSDDKSGTTPKQDDKKENTTPKQEDTTPKQEQPIHSHSYTSSVTKNPTCTENGVKTYTCSCGNSYTESIPKTDHQWVPITESVYHPSIGHYETVRKINISCGCGASGFQSQAELDAHRAEAIPNGTCKGATSSIREWTENVWVVDQPEYYSDEVTGNQCSVCGTRQ